MEYFETQTLCSNTFSLYLLNSFMNEDFLDQDTVPSSVIGIFAAPMPKVMPSDCNLSFFITEKSSLASSYNSEDIKVSARAWKEKTRC